MAQSLHHLFMHLRPNSLGILSDRIAIADIRAVGIAQDVAVKTIYTPGIIQ
jgi:hypothetical protein